MFLDIQFQKNEHKQIKILKELNYDGVFFITEEPKKHKIIDNFFVGYIKLGKSKKFLSLGIFKNIIDFKENLNNFDLFLLDFRDKEDKMDYRNSLLSPSISYLPRVNKGLLFPLIFFQSEDFEYKSSIFGRFKQNIKITKKKKNKFLPIFCSLNYFENKEKIEDYRNLFSLAKLLGLHPKQARYGLGKNLFFLYKQKLLLKENLNKNLDFLEFKNREG